MKDNKWKPQRLHWIVSRRTGQSAGAASDDGGKDRRSGRFAMRWIAMWGSTPLHSTNKSNNELKNRGQ